MRGRRSALVLFLFGVVGCASHHGCGPDLTGLDLSGEPDDCTPAGGTCSFLFCDTGDSVSSLSCGSFSFAGCCMKSSSSGGGTSDGGGGGDFPGPATGGTCNGFACEEGCYCRAVAAGGFCSGVCDCSSRGKDAGIPLDASDDAGDAGDDASDASDEDASAPDAGDDDAGDASPDAGARAPATPRTCGAIACSSQCDCLSVSLSVCQCTSGACDR